MSQAREEEYLRQLRSALGALDELEREDILAESHSHLSDRRRKAGDQGVDEALAAFGAPEDYAQQFLAISHLRRATASGRATDLFLTLLSQSPRRFAAFIAFGLTAIAYLFAGTFLLIAGAELVVPQMTGLWVDGPASPFVLGVLVGVDARAASTEILGWTLIPIMASAGVVTTVLALMISRASARYLLRKDKR